MAIASYQNFVQTFGSPAVLLAISVTLVALALLELCVRKHAKPSAGVD